VDKSTYADKWHDAINETYTQDRAGCWDSQEGESREGMRVAEWQVLHKAAECLQDGATHTFTGAELDLIRHVIPAHEVRHSDAKRWVSQNYGDV
jgi:hypothetical protein